MGGAHAEVPKIKKGGRGASGGGLKRGSSVLYEDQLKRLPWAPARALFSHRLIACRAGPGKLVLYTTS